MTILKALLGLFIFLLYYLMFVFLSYIVVVSFGLQMPKIRAYSLEPEWDPCHDSVLDTVENTDGHSIQ